MEDINANKYLEVARRMVSALSVSYKEFANAISICINTMQPWWTWNMGYSKSKKAKYLRRYQRRSEKRRKNERKN